MNSATGRGFTALIRDRAGQYTARSTRCSLTPGSPDQDPAACCEPTPTPNGFVGTVRAEVTDRMLIAAGDIYTLSSTSTSPLQRAPPAPGLGCTTTTAHLPPDLATEQIIRRPVLGGLITVPTAA